MSDLVERCQKRADLEGNDHIESDEWKALISEKYGELHGIVTGAGLRYFETTSAITATGADSYTEPTDALAIVGLDYVGSDDTRRRLRMLSVNERDCLAGTTGEAIGYTIVDDQIYLYPNPSSGSYQLLYVAQSPDLSSYADGDLVDVVTPDGEAFLIWGVTVLAKSKSESDVTLAMQREDAARERLLIWAVNRVMTEGARRPEPEWGYARTDADWSGQS